MVERLRLVPHRNFVWLRMTILMISNLKLRIVKTGYPNWGYPRIVKKQSSLLWPIDTLDFQIEYADRLWLRTHHRRKHLGSGKQPLQKNSALRWFIPSAHSPSV